MMAKKKLNPPFDWESWYQACGGRVDHTLQASKIVAKIYNEQAPKFTGFVESTTRPFGSPDQASKFVKTVAVRRQNLVDLKLPELRETLAHQVVLMLITVMHLLAERQGL